MVLGIFLYAIALCAQVTSAIYALNLFLRQKSYRLACGFLMIGLTLMVGRGVMPLIYILEGAQIILVDAFLALPISCFLLLGVFQFKKLLIDLEEKNFVLDQFSKTDSLTAAMSRSEALARSELEIKKAFRNRHPVSFLMLDIDHFKIVNDTYGHPIGDQVLISLVARCLNELRDIDIMGRVGGEEFLVVLPETPKQEALSVAERLRYKIAGANCHTSAGKNITITISIGVSTYDPNFDQEIEPGIVLKKYYALCDKAMYEAKSSGRNLVR